MSPGIKNVVMGLANKGLKVFGDEGREAVMNEMIRYIASDSEHIDYIQG
jgi:hypothetical protein